MENGTAKIRFLCDHHIPRIGYYAYIPVKLASLRDKILIEPDFHGRFVRNSLRNSLRMKLQLFNRFAHNLILIDELKQ